MSYHSYDVAYTSIHKCENNTSPLLFVSFDVAYIYGIASSLRIRQKNGMGNGAYGRYRKAP